MKITLDRLKEIIKEEIAEARLPDTMKAGFGDPQDDEREDAMGPRVPHEFSLTGKWEDDLAMLIRTLKGEQQSLDGHTNKGNKYAQLLKPTYHRVIGLLQSMQSDLGRDLPVRRHGQGEPIDPSKYVEAPSQMEQDQIVKAVALVQGAFATMAQGEKVDHTELEAAVRSAWPYGSRQYWSVKGGKSKTGGGYEYDPEMDTPTYFENLQKIIRDELNEMYPRRRGHSARSNVAGPVNPKRKLKYGEKCPAGYKLGLTDYCEKIGARPKDIENAINDIENPNRSGGYGGLEEENS